MYNKTWFILFLGCLLLSNIVQLSAIINQNAGNGDIRPYSINPWYWEYQGKPIFLRGASDQDNLWQWTGKKLTDHLDLLTSVGGNYLRCTMSDRDEGNDYAFLEIRENVYDLNQWNNDYWDRLEFFLSETYKRGIIVQLSVWDHIDLGGGRFSTHPLNPANNINWEVGFINGGNDFYGITPEDGKKEVLELQHRYVNKLLSITFRYDHILYNICNETALSIEWQNYWARFLKEKANEFGKQIHITSMNLAVATGVRHVMTYGDLFSFAEISQNNQDFCGGRNRVHYDNVIYYRSIIKNGSAGPMPMNNEKIYGATHYNAGTAREAEERFWRNIFAGAASVRFHRPAPNPQGNWGIGLSERAQVNLKALSTFLEAFDIFSAAPYPAVKPVGMSLEAYAIAKTGEKYAVYFPAGRYAVELDPWIYAEELKIKWLDIDSATWTREETIKMDWSVDSIVRLHGYQKGITLWTPSANPYIALIEVIK